MNKRPPPKDFDENPVWTREMHARARPASEVHGKEIAAAMVNKGGRPRGSNKQSVSLRIDLDVLDAFRAKGPGWQTRMNEALRAAVKGG